MFRAGFCAYCNMARRLAGNKELKAAARRRRVQPPVAVRVSRRSDQATMATPPTISIEAQAATKRSGARPGSRRAARNQTAADCSPDGRSADCRQDRSYSGTGKRRAGRGERDVLTRRPDRRHLCRCGGAAVHTLFVPSGGSAHERRRDDPRQAGGGVCAVRARRGRRIAHASAAMSGRGRAGKPISA